MRVLKDIAGVALCATTVPFCLFVGALNFSGKSMLMLARFFRQLVRRYLDWIERNLFS